MPELPEVEHVKRQLDQMIGLPRRVTGLEAFRKDLRFPIPKKLKTIMNGKPVLAIERRAKYLLFRFEDGWLLSHLGMTGSWREIKVGEERILHDHVRLDFENGLSLIFNDPRRFGFIDWVEKIEVHPRLSHLGPEPLEDEFTGEALFLKLRKRTAPIKAMIMDQRIVVGVGNIYASEALFRARIKPTRAAGRVTRVECEVLVKEIREILKEAIGSGGSTIRTYRSADGSQGGFQSRFYVYERDGEPCLRCRKELGANQKVPTIVAKMIGTRSTYWCPRCQK